MKLFASDGANPIELDSGPQVRVPSDREIDEYRQVWELDNDRGDEVSFVYKDNVGNLLTAIKRSSQS